MESLTEWTGLGRQAVYKILRAGAVGGLTGTNGEYSVLASAGVYCRKQYTCGLNKQEVERDAAVVSVP